MKDGQTSPPKKRFTDLFVNASFQVDRNGNTIYYLIGILGKGYTVFDPEKEEEIRTFLHRFYLGSFLLAIAAQVVFGVLALLFLFPFLVGAYFLFKPEVSSLPVSDRKYSYRQNQDGFIKRINPVLLWFNLVVSASATFFVVTLTISADEFDWLMLALALFLGLFTLAWINMLRRKRKVTESSES